MSLNIVKKQRARFRVVVVDLNDGKSIMLSLTDHQKYSKEDLMKAIKETLGKLM